jgi:hypothetical protein
MAKSAAIRKALTKRGTRRGISPFALFIILPLSKSAPRAVCAFIILSVSSRRVGIKRRAIVIIIASSWEGRPTTFIGDSNLSMPSVSVMGFVARVKSEDPNIRRISLRAIKVARYTPS